MTSGAHVAVVIALVSGFMAGAIAVDRRIDHQVADARSRRDATISLLESQQRARIAHMAEQMNNQFREDEAQYNRLLKKRDQNCLVTRAQMGFRSK